MSTAAEIETAIRQLPATEARAVAQWLHDYLKREINRPAPPIGDPLARWRGRGKLPAGSNPDDYLRLTRDGNGS